MKIKELIAKLRELDPELPVCTRDYEGDSALMTPSDVYIAYDRRYYLPTTDERGHIRYTSGEHVVLG